MTVESSKEEKVIRVVEATLVLLAKYGIDKLTFARVARSAKVSRPWLYKYVGSSKKALVDFAVDHYGAFLTELQHPNDTHNAKAWIEETLKGTGRLLDLAAEFPWTIHLYFRYGTGDSELGERIRRVEEMYLGKMVGEIQEALKVTKAHALFFARTLNAVRMGLAHQWASSSTRKNWEKDQLLRLMNSVLVRITVP